MKSFLKRVSDVLKLPLLSFLLAFMLTSVLIAFSDAKVLKNVGSPGKFLSSAASTVGNAFLALFQGSVFGFEIDHRFEHLQGRGIGGRFRPPRLAEDLGHLGDALQNFVLHLEHPAGLGNGNARRRHGHVEECALEEGRHEFRSQL